MVSEVRRVGVSASQRVNFGHQLLILGLLLFIHLQPVSLLLDHILDYLKHQVLLLILHAPLCFVLFKPMQESSLFMEVKG
jgi:hypothetical protein